MVVLFRKTSEKLNCKCIQNVPTGNWEYVWLQNSRLCVCFLFFAGMFACRNDHALTSNIMFIFSLSWLNIARILCLFGYLFCSSPRLNSQSSRDKVPAPRLAPHVSWNNLARHFAGGTSSESWARSLIYRAEPTPPLTPHTPFGSGHLASSRHQIYANSLRSADLIPPEAVS